MHKTITRNLKPQTEATKVYHNTLQSNEVLQYALSYAQLGLPIFPCRKDKTPIVRWSVEKTANKEIITNWWTQNPEALIGLPTGTVSGVVVLDVDIRDNKNGFETLSQNKLIIPENTLEVKTPSGGSHFYFRLRPNEIIRNSAGDIGPGIDVRGEGGYVIAAPSVAVGVGKYVFKTDNGFAKLRELIK